MDNVRATPLLIIFIYASEGHLPQFCLWERRPRVQSPTVAPGWAPLACFVCSDYLSRPIFINGCFRSPFTPHKRWVSEWSSNKSERHVQAIVPFIWPWWSRRWGGEKYGMTNAWAEQNEQWIGLVCDWLRTIPATSLGATLSFPRASSSFTTHKWACPWSSRPQRTFQMARSGERSWGRKNFLSREASWRSSDWARLEPQRAPFRSVSGRHECDRVTLVGVVNLRLYLRTQWLMVEVSISSICRAKPY